MSAIFNLYETDNQFSYSYLLSFVLMWHKSISEGHPVRIELTSNAALFPQSLHHKQDVTQGQFFLRVQLVWIQCFPSRRPVVLPKLSLSYYLPIASRETNEFMPFAELLKTKWNAKGFT